MLRLLYIHRGLTKSRFTKIWENPELWIDVKKAQALSMCEFLVRERIRSRSMKVQIINDKKLGHWGIREGEVFEVIREERAGNESNWGYWIIDPRGKELKILTHEVRIRQV